MSHDATTRRLGRRMTRRLVGAAVGAAVLAGIPAMMRGRLPGVSIYPPEATYLAWLDCTNASEAARDPFTFFLERARVALNDGALFGPGGAGFVRLNFGCPRPLLAQALDRMREALTGDRAARV